MPIKPITKVPHAERSIFTRLGSPIVITLLMLAPLVLWGAMKAAQSNNNNIRQWLPRDLPEATAYEQFRQHFGADEFAIVSWDGCNLDDPRLNRFADLIVRYSTAHLMQRRQSFLQVLAARIDAWITGISATDAAAQPLFASALTGPRTLDQLLHAPFDQKLTRDQALTRLEGILVGKDRFTSCAILRLTDAGNADRVATLEAILQTTDQLLLPRENVHVGGEVVFNAVIDIESHAAIDRLTGLSGLAAIGLAFLALRSVRLTLMVFVTSLYSAGFAYASVHYTGGQVNLILVVMPVLVYVTSISGCIHLTNYYTDAIRDHGLRGAPARALAAGWVPCLLSAATTAVGLISLAVSHIQPVRSFGIYGAWGVMATLLFLFLLLPVLFHRYPMRRLADAGGGPLPHAAKADRRAARWLRHIVGHIIRARVAILLVFAAAMLIAAAGITHTKTSVQTARFFPKDHKLVTDMRWLENHIGPLVPIEVVIDFDNGKNKLNMFERLELVAGVQARLAAMEHVGGTISPATWAPNVETDTPAPPRQPATGRNPFAIVGELRRKLLNRALEANRAFFIDQRYLSTKALSPDDAAVERWRITARFEAFDAMGYDEVIHRVEQQVRAHLASLPATSMAGVEPVFTGAVPLVHAAQQELLAGLFSSFLMAFVLIGLTMALLLRGLRAGLLSMLPCVFPAIIIFGAMGLFGFVVDVGAMLTASVAMGIAVDGTLHYLTWFRRSLRHGASKDAALAEAYTHCAGALVQTTAITGLSLFVFFFTPFQPVAQFGLLMCLMLVAALIGTMVLLPAAMATRVGNLFVPREEAMAVAPPAESAAS
jgi:predicted RND superfamily exporter protein